MSNKKVTCESQQEHVDKIKAVCEKINNNNYELSAVDIDVIQRALMCHMAVIDLDILNRKKAIECGSENGDLRSHDETKIVESCISIIKELFSDFEQYLEYADIDVEINEPFSKRYTTWALVRDLLLSGTTHAGSTSSKAKCRMLGLDPYEEIEFKVNNNK